MRVAIEVDGPTHTASNDPYHELGASNARTRMLRSLGLAVARLSVRDWDVLGVDGGVDAAGGSAGSTETSCSTKGNSGGSSSGISSSSSSRIFGRGGDGGGGGRDGGTSGLLNAVAWARARTTGTLVPSVDGASVDAPGGNIASADEPIVDVAGVDVPGVESLATERRAAFLTAILDRAVETAGGDSDGSSVHAMV